MKIKDNYVLQTMADEYIAVVDVCQYRSDMDCFIPLMKKFYETYGFYPKYPIADAGRNILLMGIRPGRMLLYS